MVVRNRRSPVRFSISVDAAHRMSHVRTEESISDGSERPSWPCRPYCDGAVSGHIPSIEFLDTTPCRLNDENSRAKVQNVSADSGKLSRNPPSSYSTARTAQLWSLAVWVARAKTINKARRAEIARTAAETRWTKQRAIKGRRNGR
jgi:hypothetical protein